MTLTPPVYIGINTIQDIQAAVLNGTLCVVCNDNPTSFDTNPTTGFMSATSTVSGWSTNYANVNTLYCPAVVAWNGVFQAFYADGNQQIIHMTSSDGLNWNWHDNTGIYTSGGISAVGVGPILHVFYRDPGGGEVFHTQWNPGASSWAPTLQLGINAGAGTSAAVLGQTVCVVCMDNTHQVLGQATSGAIMCATLSAGGALLSSGSTGVNTTNDPGISVLNEQFVVCSQAPAVNKNSTNQGILVISSSDGKTWAAGQQLPCSTSGGCCIVVFNNEPSLFYRDPGGGGIMGVTIA